MTTTAPEDVVLVAAARTPHGSLNGAFATVSAIDLGAAAIRGALEQGAIDASAVDLVIMGNVLQAGLGQAPARQAAIAAGIGWDVPAVTINTVCLSGLTAIVDGARRIRSGENPLGRIIPILAMTANAFLEDMQKSREAGMDEHLSKPVDIAALEQTVKRFRVIPPKINSGQARFRRGSTQTM